MLFYYAQYIVNWEGTWQSTYFSWVDVLLFYYVTGSWGNYWQHKNKTKNAGVFAHHARDPWVLWHNIMESDNSISWQVFSQWLLTEYIFLLLYFSFLFFFFSTPGPGYCRDENLFHIVQNVSILSMLKSPVYCKYITRILYEYRKKSNKIEKLYLRKSCSYSPFLVLWDSICT